MNDSVWLSEVGAKGWIVLTKDEKIRTRNSELLAVTNHSVGMFVVTAGNITGTAMASNLLGRSPSNVSIHQREQQAIYRCNKQEWKDQESSVVVVMLSYNYFNGFSDSRHFYG